MGEMAPLYGLGYDIVERFNTVFFHARVEGQENVPRGGCLVVANHVSFLDPTTVGWAVQREIYYLARKTLFNAPFLSWFFPRVNVVPVDQEKPDITGLRNMIKLLQQGKCVLIFPEGARSYDGQIQKAQPGSGLVVAKANVPILPVRLFGTYEILPRLAKGLRYHPMHIVIGKPFSAPTELRQGKDKEAYQKISDLMIEKIAEIKKKSH